MTQASSHSESSRSDFCARLRERREEKELSLDDIASETRIPMRSLVSLEAGRFEELPADVFVRGFLRSYARCVGLDPDETVRRYARLGFAAAPVASEMAEELIAQLQAHGAQPSTLRKRLARGTTDGDLDALDEREAHDAPTRRFGGAAEWLSKWQARRAERTTPADSIGSDLTVERAEGDGERSAEVDDSAVVAKAEPIERKPRIFLPSDFSAEDAGQRGNLTVAVIILVIVATITMSYLMRRPSHAGDGISAVPSLTDRHVA